MNKKRIVGNLYIPLLYIPLKGEFRDWVKEFGDMIGKSLGRDFGYRLEWRDNNGKEGKEYYATMRWDWWGAGDEEDFRKIEEMARRLSEKTGAFCEIDAVAEKKEDYYFKKTEKRIFVVSNGRLFVEEHPTGLDTGRLVDEMFHKAIDMFLQSSNASEDFKEFARKKMWKYIMQEFNSFTIEFDQESESIGFYEMLVDDIYDYMDTMIERAYDDAVLEWHKKMRTPITDTQVRKNRGVEMGL